MLEAVVDHFHNTSQTGAYPALRAVATIAVVCKPACNASTNQVVHTCTMSTSCVADFFLGGGGWVSRLTLHLIVFGNLCIKGQFMFSYSMYFKATHVHLHTHVIKHSHDAARCTHHRVHTQPSCTQSHTPWCWKLGAHTVGELVAGSRLLGLCCTPYWEHC